MGGSLMARDRGGATEALMRVALGIDLAIIFFGVLVVRGLGIFPDVWVWGVGGAAFVLVLGILGVISTRVGKWLGHLFHVLVLGLFAIDVAVGLSGLVPIGFWLFAAIRGPQLDAAAGPRQT